MTTSTRVDQYEPSREYDDERACWLDVQGEHYLAAKWVGTRAELNSTGLLTPAQLRYCSPVERNAKRRVGTHDLMGVMTTSGDSVVLELDFGEVAREIDMLGNIEVAKYANEVSYHGSADELVAAKVCSRKQLPGPVARRRRAKRGPDVPNARKPHCRAWWQPDGQVVFCTETPEGMRRRLGSRSAQSWDAAGIGDTEGAIASVDVSSILARFIRGPAEQP
jgi:hypothetical protein